MNAITAKVQVNTKIQPCTNITQGAFHPTTKIPHRRLQTLTTTRHLLATIQKDLLRHLPDTAIYQVTIIIILLALAPMALLVVDGAVEVDITMVEVVLMAITDLPVPDGALGVEQEVPGADHGVVDEVDGEDGEADAVAVNGASSLAWMEKDSTWRHSHHS